MEKINLGMGRGRFGRKQDPRFKPSLYQMEHEEMVRQRIMKSQYRNVFIPMLVKDQDVVEEEKMQNANTFLPDVGESKDLSSNNGNENCEQLKFVPVPMVVKDQHVVNVVQNNCLADVDESDDFFSNIVNELCEQVIVNELCEQFIPELEKDLEDAVDEVPIVEKDVDVATEVEVKEEKPLSINCQADDCPEYFVNNGKCAQGLNCVKRHAALALGSTSQCIGWTNGVCRLESSCVYRHARDSRVLKRQELPTNGHLFAPPQTNMNTQNQILALKSKVNSKYVHASARSSSNPQIFSLGHGIVFEPFAPDPIRFYDASSRSRRNDFN